MHKLLLLFILTLSFSVQASPLYFLQDPVHSRVVIVGGEEKILMPDGRILSIGQGVICTEECAIVDQVAIAESNRRWIIPVVAAGIITAVLLWDRDVPPRVIRPPTDATPAAPPVDPPAAPVPEPATLALLGFGLLVLPRFFKKKGLLK